MHSRTHASATPDHHISTRPQPCKRAGHPFCRRARRRRTRPKNKVGPTPVAGDPRPARQAATLGRRRDAKEATSADERGTGASTTTKETRRHTKVLRNGPTTRRARNTPTVARIRRPQQAIGATAAPDWRPKPLPRLFVRSAAGSRPLGRRTLARSRREAACRSRSCRSSSSRRSAASIEATLLVGILDVRHAFGQVDHDELYSLLLARRRAREGLRLGPSLARRSGQARVAGTTVRTSHLGAGRATVHSRDVPILHPQHARDLEARGCHMDEAGPRHQFPKSATARSTRPGPNPTS